MATSPAFPPRLFIIGAQKAASTTLAEMLHRQSKISLGRVKEINFYNSDTAWRQGLDWYARQFEDVDPDVAWLLDASVSYTMCVFTNPERLKTWRVPERIKETVENPRFIYALREPVDRAYASYWHTVRNGVEKRPPSEALFPASGYICFSDYASQLELFLEHFSLDQILILRSDDIITSPVNVLRKVFDFLDLDPTTIVEPSTKRHANAGFAPSPLISVGIRLFGSHQRFWAAVNRLKSVLPSGAVHRLRSLVTRPIPAIDPALRDHLAHILAPSMRRLEAMTGQDFSDWPRRS